MLFLVLLFETRVVLIIEGTNLIKVCVECLCMYILNWIFVDLCGFGFIKGLQIYKKNIFLMCIYSSRV